MLPKYEVQSLSLKSFHIVFITFAVMVTAFFGVWSLNYYSYSQNTGYLITAISSFLAAVGLASYGILIAKKLKNY